MIVLNSINQESVQIPVKRLRSNNLYRFLSIIHWEVAVCINFYLIYWLSMFMTLMLFLLCKLPPGHHWFFTIITSRTRHLNRDVVYIWGWNFVLQWRPWELHAKCRNDLDPWYGGCPVLNYWPQGSNRGKNSTVSMEQNHIVWIWVLKYWVVLLLYFYHIQI